jgi:hypothetical protein
VIERAGKLVELEDEVAVIEQQLTVNRIQNLLPVLIPLLQFLEGRIENFVMRLRFVHHLDIYIY